MHGITCRTCAPWLSLADSKGTDLSHIWVQTYEKNTPGVG